MSPKLKLSPVWKKFIALMMSMVMVLSMLPFTAFAVSDPKPSVTYNTDQKTEAEVIGTCEATAPGITGDLYLVTLPKDAAINCVDTCVPNALMTSYLCNGEAFSMPDTTQYLSNGEFTSILDKNGYVVTLDSGKKIPVENVKGFVVAATDFQTTNFIIVQIDNSIPVTNTTVSYTAQAANSFMCAPGQDVTVSSDVAESYGYTDELPGKVTALDVLVKAHEDIFGEAFTPDTAETILKVDKGFIKTIFGETTSNCGFAINGVQPHDDNLNKSDYGDYYNGYTVTNAEINNGDNLEFFIYQDGYAMDNYVHFEQDGKVVKSINADAGVPAELTLKGYSIGWYGCNTAESIASKTTAVDGVQLALVDMATGEKEDIEGAVTDEDGKVSVTFPDAGNYYLTAYMPDEEITENYATPVIMSLVPASVNLASAEVSYTAQAANSFMCAPGQNVSVSSNLAESYGYTDDLAGKVTALDVLVKAHEDIFGEAFTPDTAQTMLKVDKGFIKTIFGETTSNCGFAINGVQSHDDNLNKSDYGDYYNGYTITNAEIKNGDNLEFFIYQDGYAMDNYVHFEQDGEVVKSINADAGVPAELILKGYSIGWYGCNTAESIASKTTAVDGAQLALVDMATGEKKDIEGAVTDEDGKVSVTFPDAGNYYLTAYMPGEEITENYATPVIMSLVPVEVSDAGIPVNARLSALRFTLGMKGNEFEMSPFFTSDVSEYTVVVPDTAGAGSSAVSVWATLADTADGEITANYKRYQDNKDTTIKIQSGKTSGVPQMGLVRPNSLDKAVMTIKIGDTEAYTVNIVRQATLKELSITDIDLSPAFNGKTTDYEATVPRGTTQISINAVPLVADNTAISFDGQESNTVDIKWDDDHNAAIPVVVSAEDEESGIVGTTYNILLHEEFYTTLKVETPPDKTEYQMGESFDPAGMVIHGVKPDGSTVELNSEKYKITANDVLTEKDKSVTISMGDLKVQQPITVKAPFEGKGTKENPYSIGSKESMEKLRELVAKGISFAGSNFKVTKDLDLGSWTPIGILKPETKGTDNGKNIYPFSGSMDFDNHTITFASGSKPLFGFVREASVKNLNIIAPFISGNGLVENYTVDYGEDGDYSVGTGGSYEPGCPDTIDIINVTIKSGSIIKGSGFISGYASGGNIINISNCIIEKGVKIGCEADGTSAEASTVGSFAGQFNGTATNCVSYADVYGSKYIGGIAGVKGQSMGPFNMVNCEFSGTVNASDIYAGGIAGAGYRSSSAPNTMCAQISNCYVSGTINGKDKVGGIFGGEPASVQCWANGKGIVINNHFAGIVKATGDSPVVGAIIGYMNSMDRYNIISNNYFKEDCGTVKGIGGVNEDNVDLTSGNYGRDDDPLGLDADKLTKSATTKELTDGTIVMRLNNNIDSLHNWIQGDKFPVHSTSPVAYKLEISGKYKTQYNVGDKLDLTGMVFTATWSDGSFTNPDKDDITITGFDANVRGKQKVILSFGAAKAEFTVEVLKKETGNINVSIMLLGDSSHGNSAGDIHTYAAGNLQTWIAKTSYSVDINSTIKDVLERALLDNGMTCSNPSGNYVQSITKGGVTLGEFTNGPNSGWMYSLNGVYPDFGVQQQYLEDGDGIIFHYTDDYTKEHSQIDNTNGDVEKVIALINGIGKVTANSKSTIAAARTAYGALSENEKKKVTNYDILLSAEQAYAELVNTNLDNIYSKTANYLSGVAESYTPGISSVGGEWLMMGMARSSSHINDVVLKGYLDNVKKTLKENDGVLHDRKYTEYSRVVLALTSLGVDVTNVSGYNLLKPLADYDKTIWQGINGAIFALIAFDSHNYAIPTASAGVKQTTRENLIDCILSNELKDGGWAQNGATADVDITAMAIQSLAPYYNNESVKGAVDRALERLSVLQQDDGSFASWGTINCESCAQVVVALTAMGINPANEQRFIKNGHSVLDALARFAVDGGGFRHIASGEIDGMASEQGFYALTAYYRFKDNKTSLYDMSDVKISITIPGDTDKEPEKEPAKEPDKEPEKKPEKVPNQVKPESAAPVESKPNNSTEIKPSQSAEANSVVTDSKEEKNETAKTNTINELVEKLEDLVEVNNLPENAEDYTEKNIQDIIDAYKAYMNLSSSDKQTVEQSASYKEFKKVINKVAYINHRDAETGVVAESNEEDQLPWYIKVGVMPGVISSDKDALAEEAIGKKNKIISSQDIYFTNILDGSTWEPGDYIKITMPMVDLGEYDNAVIVHVKDDNSVELISCKINGNSIEFEADSFSVFYVAGIMGDMAHLMEEAPVNHSWIWLVAIAGVSATALAALVVMKRKTKKAGNL